MTPGNRSTLLLLAISLGGCANTERGPANGAWNLNVITPAYMDAWVETLDVVDAEQRPSKRTVSGEIVAPLGVTGFDEARGWPAPGHWRRGVRIDNPAPPRLIYVRWQSLAEPQTYAAYLVIDDATRARMGQEESATCAEDEAPIVSRRDRLTLGLAPGGIAQLWLSGRCLAPLPVARDQGGIVALGPAFGVGGGAYARPLAPRSQAYLDRHGIPYGTW